MKKSEPKVAKTALAYYRTSSAANVGEGKDSLPRQKLAVERYAKSVGLSIVGEAYDAAVSGKDPIEGRPGFIDLLAQAKLKNVGTIIVESSSRFARHVVVQELGLMMLSQEGITLIAAESPDAFTNDDPTSELVRQVLGAIAGFERSMTSVRLKVARDRKSKEVGYRIDGRRFMAENHPELAKAARRLFRINPKSGKRRSLSQIATELSVLGFTRENGQPHYPMSIKRLVEAFAVRPPAKAFTGATSKAA